MKLIRFGNIDNEKPGVQLIDGTRLDVSGFESDYDEAFFGGDGIKQLQQWLQKKQRDCPVVDERVRWAAPLTRPSKIVCVGLNYAKHAAESGMEIPKETCFVF